MVSTRAYRRGETTTATINARDEDAAGHLPFTGARPASSSQLTAATVLESFISPWHTPKTETTLRSEVSTSTEPAGARVARPALSPVNHRDRSIASDSAGLAPPRAPLHAPPTTPRDRRRHRG
ncbi:hypothetical protein EVAR_36936_1 [Eumeta japonica]|uniref:Uncharacterized protein n=1 Tax=Eumeta variegata TaxID=151549 RepID=A0A4C1X7Z8_EUMVA|nr:hypothetical protein EVAR_36936_1 [Eumeta japonica]